MNFFEKQGWLKDNNKVGEIFEEMFQHTKKNKEDTWMDFFTRNGQTIKETLELKGVLVSIGSHVQADKYRKIFKKMDRCLQIFSGNWDILKCNINWLKGVLDRKESNEDIISSLRSSKKKGKKEKEVTAEQNEVLVLLDTLKRYGFEPPKKMGVSALPFLKNVVKTLREMKRRIELLQNELEESDSEDSEDSDENVSVAELLKKKKKRKENLF